MTWGLGSNVLPIILLSVKFMIVLLSEKNEKRIYDYSVVESLCKISVQRLLKAASEKMVTYVPLIYPPWKVHYGCLPFTKRLRKILLKSKWKTPFWVLVPAENFREQRNIWKFGRNISNGNSCSISSNHRSLIPVSVLRDRFPINGTDSYKW